MSSTKVQSRKVQFVRHTNERNLESQRSKTTKSFSSSNPSNTTGQNMFDGSEPISYLQYEERMCMKPIKMGASNRELKKEPNLASMLIEKQLARVKNPDRYVKNVATLPEYVGASSNI
ncbi:hypothetical protein DdX_20570 [Ditylenchus destructor]|uniref:Uncharacterized protein n=1 Tax=Ditylenchus destructor TaxID=166010 RepID=A0AAD4MG53_9BILA|nr:hypothetical protein DdX_20570 [Ditylenchus destructor]